MDVGKRPGEYPVQFTAPQYTEPSSAQPVHLFPGQPPVQPSSTAYPAQYSGQCPPPYPPQYSTQYPNQYPNQYPTNYFDPNVNTPHPQAPPPSYQPHSYEYDVPSKMGPTVGVSVRHAFVRKVFLLLLLALLFTFGVVCVFHFVDSVQKFIMERPWIFYVSLAVVFVISLAFGCCSYSARTFPLNAVLLIIYVVAYSLLLSCATALYSTSSILIAVGITTAISLSLVLFAVQTKYDITGMGPYILVASLCLLLFGILAIILRNTVMVVVYATLGALLVSLYLVYDTQLIVGGKRYEMSVHDYILGVFCLYTDVVLLFQYVLTITGLANE